MQALSFYLTFPFIYLIASLPFPLLYGVSDFICFFVRLVGYRKEIISTNLRKSFPEKTDSEINGLVREYYSYLCDLMVETFKTLRMNEKESYDRVLLENPDQFKKLWAEKRSIILVLGHYGNWEWMGPCISLQTPYQLLVIYRPLTNIYFERMMTQMRTRFGTQITPTNLTLREMVKRRSEVTVTALIADQAASGNSYWTTFLHQDTAVFNGPEKLATKFNYPVVYLHATRPRRGYYSVRAELLVENPKSTKENEILELFTRRLEKDIMDNPVLWLWSHKRWKHAKPNAEPENEFGVLT